jgi:hypothetical protein
MSIWQASQQGTLSEVKQFLAEDKRYEQLESV